VHQGDTPVLARTDLLEAADAELLALARAGESEAFSILYERHVAAARQLAYQLAGTPRQADDVVAETFGRMLKVVGRGGGPSTAVRPYVLTAVRQVCYERLHGLRGEFRADAVTLPDPDQLLVDPDFAGLDTTLIARAYQSLPERSRAVLWHTEIERDGPAELAPLLGVTRNGVVALRRRAVEDLRQAYLQMHIALITQPGCRPVAERLSAFDRRSLSARDAALVSEHLARCEGCQVVHRELTDIMATVRGVIPPLVLGPAADAYLADAGHHGPAVTGGTADPAVDTGPGGGSSGGGTSGGVSGLSSASMPPGKDLAPLPSRETALLLAGPERTLHSPRRSLWRWPRRARLSRRAAAVAAAGVVLVITAGAALAMTLTGHDNPPASARQLPPAPSRLAATAQPSASPSPSPSPSPSASRSPAAAVVAPVRLTAGLNISRRGSSRHPEQVAFQVTNTGSAASGPVTAVIALPAGSSLSGGNQAGSGWSCQTVSGGATCTHAALPAGQQAQGMLFVTVSGTAACGQPVRLTVTSGSSTATASAAILC
jgi:RNA polymerase sigma factor (sigma-70 family)